MLVIPLISAIIITESGPDNFQVDWGVTIGIDGSLSLLYSFPLWEKGHVMPKWKGAQYGSTV